MTTDADNAPAVDVFAGVNVLTITERLCEASAQVEVLGRLVATLRGELTARAIARWREDGMAPTFRAPGLGIVSLTVPQSKVVVDSADEFACWVADNHPSEVAGAIHITGIPTDRLAGLLEQMQAAAVDGVKVTASMAVSEPYAKRLLEHDVAVADDGKTTQVVDTKLGVAVLGVKVIAGADPRVPEGPQPTSIRVLLDAQAKADAAAQADVRLAAFLAAGVDGLIDQEPPVAPPSPAAPADAEPFGHPQPGEPGGGEEPPYDEQVQHDDADGEPDERPICRCLHEQGRHGGKTGVGACRVDGCDCKRWRKAPAPAWS